MKRINIEVPKLGACARSQMAGITKQRKTELAVRTLTGICGSKAAPAAARVSAASALLDRGWGKAPQQHSGEDDKDIRIMHRQITEGRR